MVTWLLGAYWTHWQSQKQIHSALKNSIVIGAYKIRPIGQRPEQVGLVRIVSDGATNSMITDLYVAEEHRGRGVATMLMTAATEHAAVRPTLCILGARESLRAFYRLFGFFPVGGSILQRDPTP